MRITKKKRIEDIFAEDEESRYTDADLINVTEKINAEEMYEDFINGNTGVYADGVYDDAQYFPLGKILEKGRQYSLDEIMQLLSVCQLDINDSVTFLDTPYYRTSLKEYELIDCGLDGVREMKVVIEIELKDPVDLFFLDIVIKEKEGSLWLCYDVDSWSRSSTYIRYSGFVSGEASGGAAAHFYWEGYIDCDGVYKEWYNSYEEWEYNVLFNYPQFEKLMSTDPFQTMTYYVNGETYLCLIQHTQQGYIDASPNVYGAFEANRITTYNCEEIDEILSRYADEIGLTKEVIESGDPVTTP